MSKSSEDFFWGRSQIDHLAARVKMLTVDEAKHTSAACRKYALVRLRDIIDHGLLNIAKASFAFTLEVFTY
jgi:hypothetical protein